MKKNIEEKTSIFSFLLFLIVGLIITGICLDIFIQFYLTNKIAFTFNQMIITGMEAFLSTFTFFIAGLLFIVYGILEFNKLRRSNNILRIIAIVLLIMILGLVIYFSVEYGIRLQSEIWW